MTDSSQAAEPVEELFYTFQEAAKALNISDKTLKRVLEEKRIPYIKWGPKAIRIRKDVIDALGRGEELAS